MIRKQFDFLKKSFQPIIEPGQWKTSAEREALIQKIMNMKKFPLKEITDVLSSSYTISNRKQKSDLIDLVEEILIKAREPGTADTLIIILRNTADPAIRDAAIRILSEINDPKIISPLVNLLKSPKRVYRLAAVKLLDMYPAEEVGERLAAELTQGEWDNRSDALNYLFRLNRDALILPCRKALEIGSEEDKIQALKILSRLDTPEAVRAMEYAIDDDSLKLKMQLAEAFGKAGGPLAIRSLLRLVEDHRPDVVLAALDSLMATRSPGAILAVSKCLQHENMAVKIRAINTLGEIGTADEVEHLIEALKHSDLRLRQGALDALIKLSQRSETDIPKFISALMADSDVNVRRAAASILGQVDAPSIFERMFQYLRDEDWWVRETIAETLSKIKDDRIFPAAVELLGNPDPSLRRYAIEILQGIGDQRALVPIIRMLKDPDWWVRENAVRALGRMETGKVIPILANLLTIPELLYVTAEALGNIGDEDAVPHLLEVLHTADNEAKLIIMRSLEKLQAREAVPELQKLVTDPDREVRARAKEVLTRLKVDATKLDKLSMRWWEQHSFSLLDTLLLEVRYQKGSDLFLVSNNPPMARIQGEMIPLTREILTKREILSMVSQVLTPEQEEMFNSGGDLDFSYEIIGEGRFRGNMFEHANGLNLIFKLLPDEIPELSTLNLPDFLQNIVKYQHGLVLLSGPATCGKSTTLAAVIDEINKTRSDHIITIEDPIEYIHPQKNSLITQREIGHHTKSFARALRAALREDPDIILVGELRDLETISMALTAAETGHLVFATLYATSTIKAVERIIDYYPAGKQGQVRSMLAESLRCVLTQQLLPRKDDPGYVVAMEILVNTGAVASLIRDGKQHQIPSMIMAGHQHGMITMDQSLLNLVKSRVIDPLDAFTRAEDKNQFSTYVDELERL